MGFINNEIVSPSSVISMVDDSLFMNTVLSFASGVWPTEWDTKMDS